MPQQIEVPGMGIVEFPDGMNDDQIATAIKANMAPQQAFGPQDDRQTITKGLGAGFTGFNIGLADVVAAPFDGTNYLLRAAGVPLPEGSARDGIKAGFRKAGFIPEGVNTTKDIHEDFRPFARGGEVIGGSIPFAAAPLAMGARAGAAALTATGPAPGVVSQATRAAAQNPTSFALKELGPTLGAAQGAGAAEAIFPGDETAGFVGELAGAFTSPVSLVTRAGGAIGGKLGGSVTDRFLPGGTERAAGRRLEELLEEGGENKDEILRALGEVDEFGFSLAERSQSPTLMAIRQRAIAENPEMARRAMAGDQLMADAMTQRMRQLVEPGDTRALTDAAVTQKTRAADELTATGTRAQTDAQTKIAQAEADAESIFQRLDDEVSNAAIKFDGADTNSRLDASRRARDVLEGTKEQLRDVERRLWGDVPTDVRIQPRNTMMTAADLAQTNKLSYGDMKASVRNMLADFKKQRSVTAGDALQLRSQLLDLARDARGGASPNRSLARIYSELADGLLDDLGRIPGAKAARDFTRSMNDRMSRTYAGDVTRKRGTGANATSAESTLDVGPDPAKMDVRLRDFEQAAAPIPYKRGRERFQTEDMRPEMREAIEQRLRADAALVAGDPRKASAFMQKYQPVLERYPQLRDDLQNVVGAQLNAKSTRAATEAGLKGMRQQVSDDLATKQSQLKAAEREQSKAAFSRIVDAGERPDMLVGRVLNGSNPTKDFAKISGVARRGGKDAVGGLRAAVFDHLKESAAPGGTFNFKKLADEMLTPKGDATLLKRMRDNNVITTTQAARIEQLIKRGVEHEGVSRASRGQLNEQQVEDFLGMVLGAGARGVGASMGNSVAGLYLGGKSLVAASAGAKIAEKYLTKIIPQPKVKELLFRAMEDEELLKALLTKQESGAAARAAGRKIEAVLLSIGTRELQDDD